MSNASDNTSEIAALCAALRRLDCAVVCFTPEELNGADPDELEDILVEKGWDLIDYYKIAFGKEKE